MKLTNIVGLLSGLALAGMSAGLFAAPAQDAQAQDAPKPHHAHKKHHHHKHHAHKHHVRRVYENDYAFDGFYVGASVGGTTTSVNQTKIVNSLAFGPGGDLDSILFQHQDGPIALKTNNSFKGALYAGYGQCWDYWYLGAEIFADVAQYKNLDAVELDDALTIDVDPTLFGIIQSDTHTKLRNYQFGVDLRPGILLTPASMLYGRVGVAFSNLHLNTNAIFAANSPPSAAGESWDLLLPLSVEKDVAALRLGGGLEQHVCPRFNVRLDYIFTYYGKAGIAGEIDQTLASGDLFALGTDTSVKVYNNTLMLGLSYLIK